jgi:hypothetical protein
MPEPSAWAVAMRPLSRLLTGLEFPLDAAIVLGHNVCAWCGGSSASPTDARAAWRFDLSSPFL